MMEMKKEVSVQKIKKEAEELYRGGFFCSEAVVSSIRDNFELDVPDTVIAMASGFPIGIGRSKCVCGEHKEQCIAFTGLVAEKVALIIIREFDLVNVDELVTAG